MSDSKIDNSISDLSDKLSQENIDPLIAMQERISKITENIAKSFEVAQVVADIISPILEGLGKAIIKTSEIANAMQPMLDIMEQLSGKIAETIANFQLPTFTAEERQRILESHQLWGTFGWTWLPSASIGFYHKPPLDIHDANTKAKRLCSDEEMEKIFQNLRIYRLRKDDLESAIFCFQNRQYKPCALLLFGLIEAKLIRKQTKEWRAVGIGAVKALKTQVEASDEMEMFYTMLCYANLFACLETIFAKANNFKNEPVVINRNFLDHGMSNRRVRKRDCIQLFLVLQNLLLLMEKER